ncbi:MAG: nucleoside 2-deoxyribosyltransferase [Chloroflexota bacterium]
MRVICTGISGTERSGFLDAVVRMAGEIGRPLPVFDVREAMFQIAQDVGEPVEEETILDMFPPALVLLRAAALEKISNLCAQAEQHQDWIINTHAVFRWRNTLISGFDPYYLTRLQPDLYITMTSGVRTVQDRLRRHPRWDDTTIEDLLVWREEEQWATEEMARIHHKPQVVIGRGTPPSALFRLMFDGGVKSTYLAYPMQHVDAGAERGLERFKRTLEERVVVFDPADVNDFAVEGEPVGGRSDGTVELSSAAASDARLARHISDQIVFRDYKLISQADMVVVYYDALVPSPGVISEMNYALQTGKRVYGVWLPESEPSPFFTRYLTRCFRSTDELFAFFDRYQIGSRFAVPAV